MEIPYLDVNDFLKNLTENEIVEELLYMRGQDSRLSEIKIDQRSFKYLKKLGVFDSFLNNEEKKWHSFTITEQVLLRIAETFWKYGFTDERISSAVEVLLSDTWIIDFIENHFFNKKIHIAQMSKSENQSISFLEYCVLEKKKHPHLRAFTNLDALIIAALSSVKPVSIIVNQIGNWKPFTGFDQNDNLRLKFQETMFQNSFVNITIKGILDGLVFKSKRLSPILNPNLAGRKNMDSLISKGFDYKTVRELEMESDKIETELKELPVDVNLGRTKNEYANQDILIKVRGSKVSSVKQLIIKQVKS